MASSSVAAVAGVAPVTSDLFIVVGWFESVQDLFPMVGAWRLVSVEVAGTIETTLKLRVAR